MTSPDLSAFIPTNEKDAKNVHWGEMPLEALVKALNQRASQRVIRADDPWVGTNTVDKRFAKKSGSIQKAVVHQKGLYVELQVA
jgi:hypothetical protein